MAINFIVGDKLIVKQQYVKNTLVRLPRTAGLVRTIQTLEYFNMVPSEVTGVGTIPIFEGPREVIRSFIKLLPIDTTNINYKRGKGVILYFETDTLLNNSFEYSTAYLCDICSRVGLNNSGVPIPKLAVVRYTGFDTATQMPTIALANATSATTGKVMGMAEEAIVDGDTGSVIIEGAISGIDTSSYTINDTMYLSDTPGEIVDTPGTVTSIVGRAHTIGDPGSISVKGEFPFSDGGGGGGAGATGVPGVTGLKCIGDTGIQGLTGLALGSTGLQGIQGNTGVGAGGSGVTGIQGQTGIGTNGAAGATGIAGIQGLTGLALGSTGLQGTQGNTGVGGGSAGAALNTIRFAVGTSATTDSTTVLPASARVMYTSFEVTTIYTGGTTISVGRVGSTSIYLTTGLIDPSTTGINARFQDIDGGTAAIRVTVNNTPGVGAGVCVIWYSNPDA